MKEKQQVIIKVKIAKNDPIQVCFQKSMKILQAKKIIHQITDQPQQKIKLIYKGRILQDHQIIENLQIDSKTLLNVVINKIPQKQKPKQQKNIPTNFNTGLGTFNPVGFGNYSIMNHPQYMSTLKEFNDPEKLQEMLNDPINQKFIEQFMNDPQTMKQMILDNPMTKQMLANNPILNTVINNRQLMRQFLSPQKLRMFNNLRNNSDNSNNFNMNLGNIFPMMNISNTNNVNHNNSNDLRKQQQKIDLNNQQKYKKMLQLLEEMGFSDRKRNLQMIVKNKGDLDRIIEDLDQQK